MTVDGTTMNGLPFGGVDFRVTDADSHQSIGGEGRSNAGEEDPHASSAVGQHPPDSNVGGQHPPASSVGQEHPASGKEVIRFDL
jgi:hypothetical protein